MQSKHGKVCVIRTDSLNFLISKLKITPYDAGAEIARGATKILLSRGIDPHLSRNWSKVLIEKSKYAGWGKMSTTTDSRLIVHDPSLNSEFLRGYLETGTGTKTKVYTEFSETAGIPNLKSRGNEIGCPRALSTKKFSALFLRATFL